MLNSPDQRIRKRVTTIVGKNLSSAGSTSLSNVDITFANRHYVSIIPSAALAAGTVSVRGRPASGGAPVTGVQGFVPVGIEAIPVSTATNMTFAVLGFFDAFMVTIGTPISGGTVTVVVNSTIEG
jgi:hypothetical protein